MAGLGARGGSDSLGSEVPWHAEAPLALPSCRLASSTEQARRTEGRGPYDVRTQPIGSHAAVGSETQGRLNASVLRWAEVTGVSVRR